MINDENDPPVTTKRILVEQELTLWRNTLYQQQLRYRVNKKIGAEEAILKAIEVEMVKCEAAMDALQEELILLIKI